MRRAKRSTKRALLIVFVLLILAGAAGAGVYYYSQLDKNLKADYEAKLAAAVNEHESIKNTIFVAATDIKAGEELTAENLVQTTAYSSLDRYIFADTSDIGRRVMVDIAANEPIMKSTLSSRDVPGSEREICFVDEIEITPNILPGNYVDIRILYPDGTDYIVLEKKMLLAAAEGYTLVNLTEEELLLIDSALTDKYDYDKERGTKVYATKYIEPLLQDTPDSTYVPTLATITQIKTNCNISEIESKYIDAELRAKREETLKLFHRDEKYEEEDEDVLKQREDYKGSIDSLLEHSLDITPEERVLGSYDDISANGDDEDIPVGGDD